MPDIEYKGLVIRQCDDVYPPTHDTYMLADILKELSVKKCLEIGCGTGLISLLLAKGGNNVTASDLNPHAVECTRRNAGENGLDLEVVESDLFENIGGKFDIIVFNPPYLPTVDEDRVDKWHDMAVAGGIDGLEITREFLAGAKEHLNPEGIIYIIVSSLSPNRAVSSLLDGFTVVEQNEKKFFFEKITVYGLGV